MNDYREVENREMKVKFLVFTLMCRQICAFYHLSKSRCDSTGWPLGSCEEKNDRSSVKLYLDIVVLSAEVITSHTEGDVNVCRLFQGNPCNSCYDI